MVFRFAFALIALTMFGAATFLTIPAQAQNNQSDKVAATVGDLTITVGDVQRTFQSLPPQYQQQGLGAMYQPVLERLIQQEVVIQEGRKAGLATDPEVNERLEQLRDQIIHDVYLTRKVEQSISEEVLRDEYARFVEASPPQEETRARHILVETEDKAKSLIDQITNGADFATLAKEHSTGPSGTQGGDLGWFTRGRMVEAFEEAAFGLEPNQFTAEPIKTQFGWHVILVEDRRTTPAPSFEEVRPRLLERMSQQRALEIANDMVAASDVERFDMSGQPLAAPPPR